MAYMITQEMCTVVSVENLNERYCLTGLHAPTVAKIAKAGQFINLQVLTFSSDPLLKRPFSVHKVDREREIIYLLFKIIGRVTEILRHFQPGAKMQILGPLGNGFTVTENKSTLLLGGGIGAAPLYQLAADLTEQGNEVKLLLGLTDGKDLVLTEVLAPFTPEWIVMKKPVESTQESKPSLTVATHRYGLITELLQDELANWQYDQVYACGPKAMLGAVQKMLGERNSLAQFSMEEKMGCGIGLCFSCTCKVKAARATDGWANERVCTRGPVFQGDEVIFDD